MREYLKYTLLAIGLALVTKVILFYTDPMHEGVGQFYMLIAPTFTIAMLYPGMILTRNIEFEGFVSGRIISAAGVRIAVISGGINALFDYLYYTVINKQVLAHHLSSVVAKINADTSLDAAMKDSSVKGAANFFSPFMQTTFPMFICIGAGIFFTIVFAYFIRKYPEGQRRPFFSNPPLEGE